MSIAHPVPTLDDVELLPDTHAMLAQKMPEFDFKTDQRSPEAIKDLLIAAMIKYDGAGIAANQIGLEIRAFAMKLFGRPTVLFNPVATEFSAETVMFEEGCLSFPDLFLNIKRPEQCRVLFNDVDGNRRSHMLSGFEARCALHEIDHLNGVVMTSKVSKLKLDMARKKLAKGKPTVRR